MRRLTIVNISPDLLEKAAGVLPGSLGALDAIHLVSAIAFRDRLADEEPPLIFGTHDRALARVAETTKFPVLGA